MNECVIVADVATVTQFFSNPVFQAGGTATWNVPLGDRDFYWGFAVRPFRADESARVDSVTAKSARNDAFIQSTDVVVTVGDSSGRSGGCLLRFTAIKVQEP